MTSTRKSITLHGTLSGQGLEATCVVSAVQVGHSGDRFAYAQYQIQSTDRDLPDGRYELLCRGVKTFLKHENGFWLAA
jgi:hypothetical protein